MSTAWARTLVELPRFVGVDVVAQCAWLGFKQFIIAAAKCFKSVESRSSDKSSEKSRWVDSECFCVGDNSGKTNRSTARTTYFFIAFNGNCVHYVVIKLLKILNCQYKFSNFFTIMTKFAEKFQNLCYENGLNQTQAAEKLGVGQKTVSNWMTGKVTPSIPKIKRIATILGVSAEYLMNDDFNPNTQLVPLSKPTDKVQDDFEKLIQLRNEITESFSEFAAMFDKRLSNIEKILKNQKP